MVEGDSDEALMARVASGDHAAFRRLMGRHMGRAIRVAETVVRSTAEADDIAQDPEKRGVIVGIDRMLHTVHVDGEGHLWIPHVRCDLRKLYRIDYTVSSDGSRWARVPRET